MVGESATEAEFMLAEASHGRNYATKVASPYSTIDSILAVWRRTPL